VKEKDLPPEKNERLIICQIWACGGSDAAYETYGAKDRGAMMTL
jgi:hypothetical protein